MIGKTPFLGGQGNGLKVVKSGSCLLNTFLRLFLGGIKRSEKIIGYFLYLDIVNLLLQFWQMKISSDCS